jgi:predicted MPP superfamily phosphohydrolase
MIKMKSGAVLLALSVPLLMAACGNDAASAPAGPGSEAGTAQDGAESPVAADSLYGATAVENVRTTRVILDVVGLPEGWEGMRIAVVSDFQLGLWEQNEAVAAAAVRRAVATNADLIALLGDYIAVGVDTAALGRVLEPLRGRQAVAVLGDRDVRSDSVAQAITDVLRAHGIQVLRNSTATITRNGATAGVVGLDPEVVDRGWSTQGYVLATMGAGAPTPLLLAHHPPLIARAPEGKYSAALASNTFCGPVEVPGTPRLRWLEEEALPGAAVPGTERLFLVDSTVLFVTCGVGYTFVPTRLGGQPEVALVMLRSSTGPRTVER